MNLKVFNLVSWSNQIKQIKRHESCKCECRLIQLFATTSKSGIKTNADVNVKKLIEKECMIKYLFGILVIVSVNVINHAILENI